MLLLEGSCIERVAVEGEKCGELNRVGGLVVEGAAQWNKVREEKGTEQWR
jgi:hypothetical protein